MTEVYHSIYYPIHTVQIDNGSEFKSVFDRASKELAVARISSYAWHSKSNGLVERFDWTIQEEFLHQYEDVLAHPEIFQDKLQELLVCYNTIRPYQHLNYKTLLQFAQQNGGVVLHVCEAKF